MLAAAQALYPFRAFQAGKLDACYVALRSVHCTVPLVLGPKDPGRSSTVRSTLPTGSYRSAALTAKSRPDFHRLADDSFRARPARGWVMLCAKATSAHVICSFML